MFDRDHRTLVRQVVKFGITGGSGLVANLLLLSFLVEVTAVPQEYAAILSTGIVLVGSFVLTDFWVFDKVESRQSSVTHRGVGYFAIMIGGKLVNYVLYLLFLSFDVQYQVAWFAGSILVFVLTFTGNRLLWYDRF